MIFEEVHHDFGRLFATQIQHETDPQHCFKPNANLIRKPQKKFFLVDSPLRTLATPLSLVFFRLID